MEKSYDISMGLCFSAALETALESKFFDVQLGSSQLSYHVKQKGCSCGLFFVVVSHFL